MTTDSSIPSRDELATISEALAVIGGEVEDVKSRAAAHEALSDAEAGRLLVFAKETAVAARIACAEAEELEEVTTGIAFDDPDRAATPGRAKLAEWFQRKAVAIGGRA